MGKGGSNTTPPVSGTASYSDTAISELLYLLEEEKLAGDIYEAFFALYGLDIFANIARSEDSHFNALLRQAEGQGLNLTAILAEPAGSYTDEGLQALYDTLFAQGSLSETAALEVGKLIEETDIVDLKDASTSVEGTALATVYDNLLGGSENHLAAFQQALDISALPGLTGGDGNDNLTGTEGADTIIGNGGDDTLTGGTTVADLRDVVYGGDGNDVIDGGYGNDELRGDGGDDTIAGGFGADTVIGGDGNDVLSGQALGDDLFGGDGSDFLNGGFGFDRLNGGAGADQFYHQGDVGHGSDWIQDYAALNGDVLVFGRSTASADDFQVNLATTDGAGSAAVEEAFVIYKPTGQILWALVDGASQAEINILIGGMEYDLLA